MKFQRVTEFLDQGEALFGVPCCECMVFQDHRLLYRHWRGSMDTLDPKPVQGGEWYWIYSCTKPVTMTAVMQLWEAGKLQLDDPVSRYLPEFGKLTVRRGEKAVPARNTMTIRHLMTMTAGFNYDLQSPSLVWAREHTDGSTREMIRALAGEPLEFEPGTHFRYSLCHDVAGAVVEAASGLSLPEYIQTHIARPLGITGMTFYPNQEQLDRMPNQLCWHDVRKEMFRADKENTFRLSKIYASGGAGLCCRVEDYILFADALACGGVGKTGRRILKPETIAYMAANHLRGRPLEDYHTLTKPESEGYGLGLRVHMARDEFPAGEFGWDGAGGALAIMEPSRRLSVFYAQHVSNYLPSYAQLHPELMRRIYQEVDAR